jgi:hypothetical protein
MSESNQRMKRPPPVAVRTALSPKITDRIPWRESMDLLGVMVPMRKPLEDDPHAGSRHA